MWKSGINYAPEPKYLNGIGENRRKWDNGFRQGNRIYSMYVSATCLMAQPLGNHSGYTCLYLMRKGDINEQCSK
jgi:hypothetical protein